jgi:hypothetical protein
LKYTLKKIFIFEELVKTLEIIFENFFKMQAQPGSTVHNADLIEFEQMCINLILSYGLNVLIECLEMECMLRTSEKSPKGDDQFKTTN